MEERHRRSRWDRLGYLQLDFLVAIREGVQVVTTATGRAITRATAVLAVCAIFLATGAQAQQQGELTVTPNSGPVGTTVAIEGTGCNNPGDQAYIAFGGEAEQVTGTAGADDIPNVEVDAQDHFKISYAIPAELHSIQGRGGGAVVPGTYKFFSTPPYCSATFTVTASGLPPGGTAPAGASSRGLVFWAIAGFGIAAVGAGGAIVRSGLRRRR
jgi:hypothetical protein